MRWLALLLAFALPAFAPGGARAAAYAIGSGDTLAITVYHVPDMSRRTTVNLDGNITLPPLGQIRAAGLTLADLGAQLRQLLTSHDVVRDAQVSVELIETRPVFVNGDVSKPGEYAFRPGLTVRDAVALAGGYDLLHFRTANPVLEAPDFKAESDAAALDLAQQLVHVAVLEAERDGRPTPDLPNPDTGPVPQTVFLQLVASEEAQQHARQAQMAADKQAVRQQIGHVDDQLVALNAERAQEEDNVRQITSDVTQEHALFSKGLTSLYRLQDEQRDIALSRSRLSESIANIALAERGRDELTQQLARIDDDRRLAVLAGIEQGNVEIRKLSARLAALQEKLLYVGALRSELRQRAGDHAAITVWRQEGGKQAPVTADEGTPLLPGDSVDIRLQTQSPTAVSELGSLR